jgi:hypothetical protein
MGTHSFFAEEIGFNSMVLNMRLEGLDREALLTRPGGKGNHLVWLTGHLAASRSYILGFLGADDPVPTDGEKELFGGGVELPDDDPFPPIEELLDRFHQRGEAIAARLAEMTDEDFAAESDPAGPFGGNTVGGRLRFMMFHETEHIGQVLYVSTWLGVPRIA